MIDPAAIRLLPCGDAALTVELGDRIDPALNAAVLALDAAIAADPPAGLVETVPTYRSLLLAFGPDGYDLEAVAAHVRPLAAGLAGAPTPRARLWRVPSWFGGDAALDLADAAAALDMAPEALLERFCAAEYRVYMLGFMPGYAYLGGLPAELTLPRRKDPRLEVPAGSVMFAGIQAGIVPGPMPAGWHVIGRTPLAAFDRGREPPFLFQPGDRVRFAPIDAAEFARRAADPDAWRACLEPA